MKKDTQINLRLTQEELAMLKRLALCRGNTMTAVLRMYVRNSYAKLPEGAK